MNYIKYLQDARMINLLYAPGEEYPKKPVRAYMYNPNLMYVMNQQIPDEPAVNETFFCNQLIKDNNISESNQNARFLVNGDCHFQIVPDTKGKFNPDIFYAVDKMEIGGENLIPLWLFGFLY